MASVPPSIEEALAEAERLRRNLKKSTAPQVRSSDERALAKATASAWFHAHKPALLSRERIDTHSVDECYRTILETSDRHGARSKYMSTLTALKRSLINLRTACVTSEQLSTAASDQAPDFSPLVPDADMREILRSRWDECLLCLQAGASLAATVMMGGLLEAILLARVNVALDKSPLFTAKSAPKDGKGVQKPLKEWMLKDFIQVLAEVRWITVSTSAVGAVLRDYRNYIHPQKQLSHSMRITTEDAALFWEVTKNIVRQIVGKPP